MRHSLDIQSRGRASCCVAGGQDTLQTNTLYRIQPNRNKAPIGIWPIEHSERCFPKIATEAALFLFLVCLLKCMAW